MTTVADENAFFKIESMLFNNNATTLLVSKANNILFTVNLSFERKLNVFGASLVGLLLAFYVLIKHSHISTQIVISYSKRIPTKNWRLFSHPIL